MKTRSDTVEEQPKDIVFGSTKFSGFDYPILSEWGLDDIRSWEDEVEIYKNKMKDHEFDTTISVKTMVDRDLIRSICMLYLPSENVDTISEDQILSIIHNYKQERSVVCEETMKDVIRSKCRVDLKIQCPSKRVMDFSKRVNCVLQQQNFEETFNSSDTMKKELIEVLLDCVEPLMVRRNLKSELKKQEKKHARDMGNFMRKLLEISKEQQKFWQPKANAHSGSTSGSSNKNKKRKSFGKPDAGASNPKVGKIPKSDKDYSEVTCLFCNVKGHRVWDCQKASREEKKTCWDKFKQELKEKRKQKTKKE